VFYVQMHSVVVVVVGDSIRMGVVVDGIGSSWW